jgi:hypothetical protein
MGLLLMAAPALAHDDDHGPPPWQGASARPDRVVATFDADPSQSLAVSWRTDATVKAARAEIVLATPDARIDVAGRSVAAVTERMALDTVITAGRAIQVKVNAALPAVSYHSVRFDALVPDTLYA